MSVSSIARVNPSVSMIVFEARKFLSYITELLSLSLTLKVCKTLFGLRESQARRSPAMNLIAIGSYVRFGSGRSKGT